MVRGRSSPGTRNRGNPAIAAFAHSIRNSRDCRSVQCRAPSTSDHTAPKGSPSSARRPSSRAAIPKRISPRFWRAPATTSLHGKGLSSASQQSSRADSSRPEIPRGISLLATACNRGSAGAERPWSNASRRSRHQANRIAPSSARLLVETTSANARSRFQSARKAGRTRAGVA